MTVQVDDTNIRLFLPAGWPVALVYEGLLQGFGFKLIDLAPQGFYRKRRHRDIREGDSNLSYRTSTKKAIYPP